MEKVQQVATKQQSSKAAANRNSKQEKLYCLIVSDEW
jgi:hypothetical protein